MAKRAVSPDSSDEALFILQVVGECFAPMTHTIQSQAVESRVFQDGILRPQRGSLVVRRSGWPEIRFEARDFEDCGRKVEPGTGALRGHVKQPIVRRGKDQCDLAGKIEGIRWRHLL